MIIYKSPSLLQSTRLGYSLCLAFTLCLAYSPPDLPTVYVLPTLLLRVLPTVLAELASFSVFLKKIFLLRLQCSRRPEILTRGFRMRWTVCNSWQYFFLYHTLTLSLSLHLRLALRALEPAYPEAGKKGFCSSNRIINSHKPLCNMMSCAPHWFMRPLPTMRFWALKHAHVAFIPPKP